MRDVLVLPPPQLIVRVLPAPFVEEWRFERLEQACLAAGCTRRQAEVIRAYVEGQPDQVTAAQLGISPERVRQTLIAAVRKIDEHYAPEISADPDTLLKCMANKRLGGSPPTPVYDRLGRQVGTKAKAFGQCPEDLAVRPERTPTQVLLELVCRVRSVPVPALRYRTARKDRQQCAAAVIADWRRQREAVGSAQPKGRKSRRRSQSPA